MRRTLSILGLVTAALVSIGIVVLASAGGARGLALYNDPNYFVKRQAVWLVVALLVMAVAVMFDYHNWRDKKWLTIALFVAVLVMLGVVFAFPKINGSYRWLDFKRFGVPMRLQPSELAKLATVLCVSVWLERAGFRVTRFLRGAVVPCAIFGAVAVLLVLEPDYGSTMVVLAVGFTLMFLAGTKLWHLVLLGVSGFGMVVTLVWLDPNRRARLMAWLHGNEGDGGSEATRNAYYQLQQAIVAICNGGVTGVGYNQSMQKQYYLPEAHTDFIFAIGAEELGLFFSIAVLLLFLAVFVCGMYVSMHASDRLGGLLAFGMTFLVAVQAIVNIGVVTGCLPTKGLALPLISYGGTNLISALTAIGIIMNVAIVTMRDERRRSPRVVPVKTPDAV